MKAALHMIDIREYEQLARETGAYKDIELEILKETLLLWKDRPGDPYTLLELRDGKILAGFVVASRTPNTEFTFDVRDFCIDQAYIGKGVSARLVEMLEEEVGRIARSAIVRVETSRRKEDALGRGTLAEAGYALIGHIPDFYEPGDDYFIFAKHVKPGEATDAAPAASAPASPEGPSTPESPMAPATPEGAKEVEL
jgi:GNAT superfamily N-acetyltransferase